MFMGIYQTFQLGLLEKHSLALGIHPAQKVLSHTRARDLGPFWMEWWMAVVLEFAPTPKRNTNDMVSIQLKVTPLDQDWITEPNFGACPVASLAGSPLCKLTLLDRLPALPPTTACLTSFYRLCLSGMPPPPTLSPLSPCPPVAFVATRLWGVGGLTAAVWRCWGEQPDRPGGTGGWGVPWEGAGAPILRGRVSNIF